VVHHRRSQTVAKGQGGSYRAAQSGQLIYIPPICIVECIYLAEKSRIPAAVLDAILAALALSNSALKLAASDVYVADAVYKISRQALRVSGIATIW
jgi:hypothetical protein